MKGLKISAVIVGMIVLSVVSYFMFFKKDSKLYLLKDKPKSPEDEKPPVQPATSTGQTAGTGAGTAIFSGLESTPFKSTTEGNKFRAWVNDKHPDYARSIDLDRTGKYDNSYIRKAWASFGEEYNKAKESPASSATEGGFAGEQNTRSFDSSWYDLQADKIYVYMDGITSQDEKNDTISSLKRLRTDKDWYELYTSFDKKEGTDLRGWLNWELSNWERHQINENWKKKGMSRKLWTSYSD